MVGAHQNLNGLPDLTTPFRYHFLFWWTIITNNNKWWLIFLKEYSWNSKTRTYVSGTVIYSHMPILRPHATRFRERRIFSVRFTSAHLYGNVYMRVGLACALADSSDFELLGEQSSQKWEISSLGGRWVAVQNLTPLALSSAEKSVTVQKHTHKQTNKITNKYVSQWGLTSIHTCRSYVHTLRDILRTAHH